MYEIKGHDQIIAFSVVGGTPVLWQYHGVDVLYPQQQVRIKEVLKVRGGMHACCPNFDSAFGLPKHGPLRNRKPDHVTGKGGFIFRGRDLLGEKHDEECEIQINVTLEPEGFLYVLSARLTEAPKTEVFFNPGLHPYFRTPEHEASAVVSKGRKIRVHERQIELRYEPIENETVVSIPGLGFVQMSMSGNAWTNATRPKVVLWRDSYDYLCVEPVVGESRTYGKPACLRLTEEPSKLRCRFRVRLA